MATAKSLGILKALDQFRDVPSEFRRKSTRALPSDGIGQLRGAAAEIHRLDLADEAPGPVPCERISIPKMPIDF